MAETMPRKRRSRASILHLMGLIVLTAIGFAALKISTFAWLKAMYATTMTLLLFAVVASRYRRGLEGAFWFGFAVFGWGYAVLGIAPWQTWGNASVATFPMLQRPALNPLLWTKDLVERYASTRSDTIEPPSTSGIMTPEAYQQYRVALYNARERSGALVGIAHLLFTWAFGAIGGLVGVGLARFRGSDGREDEGSAR